MVKKLNEEAPGICSNNRGYTRNTRGPQDVIKISIERISGMSENLKKDVLLDIQKQKLKAYDFQISQWTLGKYILSQSQVMT